MKASVYSIVLQQEMHEQQLLGVGGRSGGSGGNNNNDDNDNGHGRGREESSMDELSEEGSSVDGRRY